MRIYYWPDGMWCYEYELNDMNHKSDDCSVFEIEGDAFESDIDMLVNELTS